MVSCDSSANRTNNDDRIGVSTEHVESDDDAATVNDYDLNEALAAYRTRTPRTGLEIAAGYGKVDGSGVSQDDPIVRIGLWRRVSSFSSVQINLSQDYSTSALHSLGDSVLSDVIVISEYALAQSDPYRVRLARSTGCPNFQGLESNVAHRRVRKITPVARMPIAPSPASVAMWDVS